MSDGGSDPSVLSVLGVKSSQSHGIVDPLTAPVDQVSDLSRIKMLAEAYLSNKRPTLKKVIAPPVHHEMSAPVDMCFGDLFGGGL